MPSSIAGQAERGRMISSAIVTPFNGQRIVQPLLKANRFSAESARK
jgi:hypothetical protein